MKYETPELTALTPAINAIQGTGSGAPKVAGSPGDGSSGQDNEHIGAYADWE
jgi:hypothetical protein